MATAVLKKYINVPPPKATTAFGKQLRAQTFAYNRLGGTLTGIGKNLQGIVTMMEFQKEFLLENFLERTKKQEEETNKKLSMRKRTAKKKKKKEDRIQDQEAETAQELEPNEEEEKEQGLDQAEKADKKKFSWIETLAAPFKPLFSFLKNLIGPFIAVGFMKWLSDPKNTKRIETFLKFIRGLGKLVFGLVSFGMNNVLEGIGNIFGDREPGQSHLSKAFEAMFGVFKILGGMASFWLASRMLMPWKLLSDVKAMRSIGRALTMGEKPDFKKNQKNQKKDNKKKNDKKNKKDNKKKNQKKQQKKNQKTTKTKTKAPKPKPKTFADRIKQTKETIVKKRKAIEEGAEQFVKKNVKPLAQKGQKLLEKVKVKKPPGGGSWWKSLKSTGQNLWKTGIREGTKLKNVIGEQGSKFVKWADGYAKKQLANADNVIGGIRARAAKWANTIGDVVELAKNPMKLVEKVKKQLMGQIDNILKKNKTIKQVMKIGKNPKEIGKILKGASKNKNVLKLKDGLKAAKKMKIGGVDKVIAAIMGVIDYALLGESPVNAILRALGGLLGYTAGFAIGAPFGGAPGFITGMAGGFVGEQAARLLAKGLVHMPTPFGKLGTIDDPFAKATGLSPRKIVRDPDDTAMNDKLSGDQQKLAEKREKEDAKDIKPADKEEEKKKVYPHKSPFKKGKEIKFSKKSANYNRKFDLSRTQGGLTNEQYANDLDKWERRQVTSGIRQYSDLTGIRVSLHGWDHKKQEARKPPEKGMGGTIPFQIGKKSIGGRINTRDAVGSKVPKINRPIKRKRRARTNTVVVAARQQVYIPGSSPTPPPKVVYTATPVMLNGNMRS